MKKYILILLLTLLIIGCSSKETIYKSTALEVGINPDQLVFLTEIIDTEKYSDLKSFLIMKDDKIFYEKYRTDIDEDQLSHLNSATKTITSILVGIALDKGFIKSIDDPVYTFFPEYINDIANEKFKNVTIRHLLTMTDGIKWKDHYGRDVLNEGNAIQYAFKQKTVIINGLRFRYSTLDSQLLSGIITKTTGLSELEFANQYLFEPMNIKDLVWTNDILGYTYGGFGLQMKPKDMMKIGRLLLNNGRFENDQIVSENWILEMTKVSSDGGNPHREKYGLHIWIDNLVKNKSYFAGGFGGQFIYIVPNYKLVVVTTSDSTEGDREFYRDLIESHIIPSIKKY